MARSCAGILVLVCAGQLHAGEIPEPYRDMVTRGLTWLARQQRQDGAWAADRDQYPVAVTSLAGMALALQGSTVRDGAYAANLRKSIDWLLARSQKQGRYQGLIGDPENIHEAGRYMFGHGLALEYLATVYGDVDDAELRKRIADVLNRGVKFAATAQTSAGGWFYTSKEDSNDAMSESVVTVFVLTGLTQARAAGIAVPKETRSKAFDYLRKASDPQGGVVCALGADPPTGGGRPIITAAALFLRLDAGEQRDPLVAKHLVYCRNTIVYDPPNLTKSAELVHYFFAQALWRLGDDGYAKLFPDSRPAERLTWSRYRTALFDHLKQVQQKDGSWDSQTLLLGPVLVTAVHLITTQQDRQAPLRR